MCGVKPHVSFFPLALASLRRPSGHEALGTRSSTTSKLQSCKRCFVIFHPHKPGSRSQKPRADRKNPRAVSGGIRAVTSWTCLGKSPSGNRILLSGQVLSPQREGRAPPQRAEPPGPPCLKDVFRLCYSQESSPGPGRARDHLCITTPAIPAPQQQRQSLEGVGSGLFLPTITLR